MISTMKCGDSKKLAKEITLDPQYLVTYLASTREDASNLLILTKMNWSRL